MDLLLICVCLQALHLFQAEMFSKRRAPHKTFGWCHRSCGYLLLAQFAVRFHKPTLLWLPHHCLRSAGSKVGCTCRGPVDSNNLRPCCLLFPVVWFNQALHHTSHRISVCVRRAEIVWESSLFLCVSLQGAGKKSTPPSESSQFSLRFIVGWDLDLSREVLMYSTYLLYLTHL